MSKSTAELLLLSLQRTVAIALRVLERNNQMFFNYDSIEQELCDLQRTVYHCNPAMAPFSNEIDRAHNIIKHQIEPVIGVSSADGVMCDMALIQLQQHAAPFGAFTYFYSSDPEGPPSSSSGTIVKMSSGTRQYLDFGDKFTFPPVGDGEVIFPRLHNP